MTASAPSRLGKYNLVARIAKGGMAEIYLARQRATVGFSRLVVIKRILPHLAEMPQFVRMFLQEARLAALISHPNVVQIFDVDQFEGHYYIAMEYLDGPSLGTVLRKLRRMGRAVPYPVAAEVVAQACEGLHAAHELVDDTGTPIQLVHRDVSPHNLMITVAGVVKLVDFGIAKAQGSAVQTRTGTIKGKYPYMSPEQCRGDPLDRRTDLFSLGAVFYELLTGKRLFQRATELMSLKAIVDEPIPRAGELVPELPIELDAFLAQCLERERERRFPTAAAMGQALRSTLSAIGVPSSPALLADYLRREHTELLVSRSEALRKASALSPAEARIPEMEGLGEGSQSESDSALDVSAEEISLRHLPPPPPRWSRRQLLFLGGSALTCGGALAFYLLRRRRPRPAGPPLLFGVPPSFPAAVAETELADLLRYLEQRVGRRIEIVVPPSYHGLREALLRSRVDFASVPPLEFVMARSQNSSVVPLVSNLYEGSPSYQSLLLARDDVGISSVGELRGKRFCYVDPESTSGYLLPRYFLRQQQLDPDKLFASTRFSGDHLRVMRDIVSGECDAGAVYTGAMINAAQHGVAASRLRLLAVTGHLPYDVICASPSLPAELSAKLGAALLHLDPQRDLGRRLVGPTFRISGFSPPRLAEFAKVERAARAEGLIR